MEQSIPSVPKKADRTNMKIASWISLVNALVRVATEIIRVLRLLDNDNRTPTPRG